MHHYALLIGYGANAINPYLVYETVKSQINQGILPDNLVYGKVIENERAGKYLGETVQFIPHIPDEIKKRIKDAAEGFDFCLVEIGGTIGDYENIPFLFAMKSLERELGKENVVYVLITYLPVPSHIEEMKTKPTQQATKQLLQLAVLTYLLK